MAGCSNLGIKLNSTCCLRANSLAAARREGRQVVCGILTFPLVVSCNLQAVPKDLSKECLRKGNSLACFKERRL